MKHNLLFLFFVYPFLIPAFCYAQPAFTWAKTFGGLNDDFAGHLAKDRAGNIYTLGSFKSTTDFDPGLATYNLTSEGEEDIFVSKLGASGNFIWAKRIGNSGFDVGTSLAVDDSGNVYVTGHYSYTLDLNPGSSEFNVSSLGSRDFFVLKLNASGNFVWGKSIGGKGFTDYCNAVALDNSGHIYLTGQFSDTVDFDTGPGLYNVATTNGHDIFVCKLDTSGNFVWVKNLGNNNSNVGNALTIDANDNVYVTGEFTYNLDFDPGPEVYELRAYPDDAFILKLDSVGNFVWARSFICIVSLQVNSAIKVDDRENVYAVGYYSRTTDFDPGPTVYELTSSGLHDICILKLNRAGNFVWAKSIGGSESNDWALSIALDDSANLYVAGQFGEQGDLVDFDPGIAIDTLRSSGKSDVFILKLDSAGNYRWARKLGGSQYDAASSIILDDSTNIYLSGRYCGTGDFDPGIGVYNLVSNHTSFGFDVFVVKLQSSLPHIISFCQNGNNSLVSNMIGVAYQWQVDAGSGYANISNNSNYSGVNTSTSNLTNVLSSWNGYKYRCAVDGIFSEEFSIKIVNTWTGAVNSNWETIANWSCGILPDSNTDVIIKNGTVLVNSNVTIRSLQLGLSANFTITPSYNITILH